MENIQSKEEIQILEFTVDELCCGLEISVVERVIRAVEIIPLPSAPEIVKGVINIRGRIIPVISVHKRFRMPDHETGLDDRFIIARTSKRTVALAIDDVVGIYNLASCDISVAGEAIPYVAYIKGAVRAENNIIFIYDLEQFLSLDDETRLDIALSRGEL